MQVYSTPGVDLEWNKCYSVEYPRLLETPNFMHNKQCVSIGNPQSSEYNNFLGTQSVNFEFNKLFTLHSGLMLLFIRDLDSVLLYVVKVRGSLGWIATVNNQSNMVISGVQVRVRVLKFLELWSSTFRTLTFVVFRGHFGNMDAKLLDSHF